MPRRTKEDAAQTREALLNTAMRLYAQQGIHAVSLKHIAAACDVTHGALYWHFRNRDDLLQQLYLAAEQPYEAQYIEQRQSVKQDPLQALQDYLCGVVRAYVQRESYCCTYRLFLTRPCAPELQGLEPQIDTGRQVVMEHIHYFLKQAKKKKQLSKKLAIKSVAKVLAEVLDSQVQGIAFASLESRTSDDADLLIGLILAGLKA